MVDGDFYEFHILEFDVECASSTAQFVDLYGSLLSVEILLALHAAVGFNTSLVNQNTKPAVCVVAAIELVGARRGWPVVLSTLVALNHDEIGAVVSVHAGRPGFCNLVGCAGKTLHLTEVKRGRLAGTRSVIDATGAWRVVAGVVVSAVAVTGGSAVVTGVAIVAGIAATTRVGVTVVWVRIRIGRPAIAGVRISCSGV